MAASTKTKAVVALGVLDLARQAMRGWSARQEAHGSAPARRLGRGARDAREAARDRALALNDELHAYRPAWGLPPWRRRPTVGSRVLAALPLLSIVLLGTAAVVATARWVARHDDDVQDQEALANDTRVKGAIKASSHAIDAGVTKVVEGGHGMAVGAVSAVAAGKSVAQTAVVDRAKHELDERVVAPAKAKAIKFGALGVLGLTLYIIVIVVIAQLVVAWLG